MPYDAPTCFHCGRPIPAGEQRWAGHEPEQFWHYRCAKAAGLKAANLFLPIDLSKPAGPNAQRESRTERDASATVMRVGRC